MVVAVLLVAAMTSSPAYQPDAESNPGNKSGARSVIRLKVEPPYFDALMSGEKTFEVRKNDRAYQRGDILQLIEWHPARAGYEDCYECRNQQWKGHATKREVGAKVMYVYSGDPRWGGIEPGYVVLALAVGAWAVTE